MKLLSEAYEDRDVTVFTKEYRQTSRDTWETIKNSGFMAGQHGELYECLVKHYPITVAEITPIFNAEYGYDLPRNEVAKRMYNLRSLYQVVVEAGYRVCKENGKVNIAFAPNNQRPPEQLPKRKPKSQEIKELTEELEFLKALCRVAVMGLMKDSSENSKEVLEQIKKMREENNGRKNLR